MLSLRLRLIDSNFPVLGLRPPLCCVYVAPCPAGSIRSLPFAHPSGFVYVARFPSAPLIDSRPPLINALALSRLSVSAPAGRIPAGNVYLANLQWNGKSQNEISTGARLRSSPARR